MKPAVVGSLIRLQGMFDVDGEAIDPESLVLSLRIPGGDTLTFVYPTATEITREEEGVYNFDYVPMTAGTYVYSWNASANLEVTSLGVFEVVTDSVLTRAPKYMTSADLDARIGAAKVDQLFDDDGDSHRDALVVNTILVEAEDFAAARMLKGGWSQDGVEQFAAHDETYRSMVAWVAIELATERRPEFVAEDGKGRYWAQYIRAKEHFDAISKSKLRSPAEGTVGANKQGGGSLSPMVNPPRPSFVWAPDRHNPNGRGGF
jgi:hypothetical protein